jgi:hypothetical protein
VIATSERVEFLKKSHLFYGVNEDQLLPIAAMLEEKEVTAQAVVFSQGSSADNLYLIYSGSVRVVWQRNAESKVLAKREAGDYFGEEELLTGKPRYASIIADTNTVLLVIPAQVFKQLVRQIPRLKTTIEVDVKSHRLERITHFDWLAEDERFYFLARKHWVLLAQSLVGPALTLGLALFLVAWGLLTHAAFPAYAGGVLIWPALGWAVWQAIDWGNDYYIVTNQRVIWLEKVIGLYDSRQEAPLATLLSVGVETDMLGRTLNYGTVVVRTFVGRIEFNHVTYPYEASHLISEHWERTKQVTSSKEKEAIRSVLRQKLGLTVPGKPSEAPVPVETKPAHRSMIISLAGLLGGNLFKIRFEDSGTITYRKHWFVLIRQVWQPSAFILILLLWMFFRGFHLLVSRGTLFRQTVEGRTIPDTILVSLPFVIIPFLLWWIYQYWDWKNDIFQVTPDQIVDIDKKPFGTEERRAAPLDNILSTQYSRIGLTGYIFNFGTVYITVGGSQLAFEDVSDPASVQSDIDRRRVTSLARKKEAESSRERERMADWLAAYNENAHELDLGHELPEDGKKIE